MHKNASWRLQDAKARFSAVVEAAVNGEVQHVTRRGKQAVVVIAAAEYERLRHQERAQAPGFIEHLMAVPRTRPTTKGAGEAPAARLTLELRDVAFE